MLNQSSFQSVVNLLDKIVFVLLNLVAFRYLTVEDFGLYQKITMIAALGGALLGAVLPYVSSNFSISNLQIISLSLINATLAFFLTVFLSQFISVDHKGNEIWVGILGFFAVLYPISKYLFVKNGENKRLAIFSSCLFISIALGAYFFKAQLEYLNFYLLLIMMTYGSYFLFALTRYLKKIYINRSLLSNIKLPQISSFKSVSILFLCLFVNGLIENLDSYIGMFLFSNYEYGIYRVGTFRLPFIEIITGAVAFVMISKIPSYLEKNDIDVFYSEWREVTEKVTVLLIPIVIYCIIHSSAVLTLLFGEKSHEASPIFMMYLAKFMFCSATLIPIILVAGGEKIWLKVVCVLVLFELLALTLVNHLFPGNLVAYAVIPLVFQYIMIFYQLKLLKSTIGINFMRWFPLKLYFNIAIMSVIVSSLIGLLFPLIENVYIQQLTFSMVYYSVVVIFGGKYVFSRKN